MPSHLRLQSSLEEPISANAIYHSSASLHPAKKQKFSMTQIYYVASTARGKLGREASKADHNLRRLVGHANLLDNLMLELADAEREQEAWFNQSVRKASKQEEPRHIQWVDTIAEEDDEQSDSDSDADSEYDEDEEMFDMMPLRKIKSPPVTVFSAEIEDEDMDADYEEDDDEEDEYALRRVPSNRNSPPELLLDDESESEDEDSTPASPENVAFELSDKQREAITTTTFYDTKTLQDFAVQQQSQQPLIAAC